MKRCSTTIPTRARLSSPLASIDSPSCPPTGILTGAEIELVSPDSTANAALPAFLDACACDFDYIFIDTPPSLGLLTLNALVAADTVLIPLNCEYFALEGIADLMATIDRVRTALNPSLAVEGVLLTMYDDRTNLGQQVARTSASSSARRSTRR